MTHYTPCLSCRICGNTNLVKVFDLGMQSLTSVFPLSDEPSPPLAPQVLVRCDDEKCGLVQMSHSVSPNKLYIDNAYGYRSGINTTMTSHLSRLAEYAESIANLQPGDVILDIGANDGTLLSKYKSANIKKIAIDPTASQFYEFYEPGIVIVPSFFDRKTFAEAAGPGTTAKVVTTISMFYDLPSPQDFACDVSSILHPEGIWIMEQSYLPSMIECMSFDTVCHEHLEYYTLKQILLIAKRAGLRVIDVSLNDCNGGSFRVTLCHIISSRRTNYEAIDELMKREEEAAWDTMIPYKRFEDACKLQRDALMTFLRQQKSEGKTIAVYGASTKGNTLLQYYGIDSKLISCVAERNPRKFGRKTPGSEIPIKSESEVRELKPDYMLVLPWHFKEEFLQREQKYLEDGGTFIFPLPHVDIVSRCSKKTAVILGGSGQLGVHLIAALGENRRVFNLSRTPVLDSNVTNIPIDLTTGNVHTMLLAIKPDEIYNLAAVTDLHDSITHPLHTHMLNAALVVQLVESVQSLQKTVGKPVKLFQTGSVEMFKGSNANEIDEESIASLRPTTPYAVSKLSAFWTIKIAREESKLFACTGIPSNVESSIRRSSYVTKKIVNYFKKGDFGSPLELGDARSTCDWVHARDVADAILRIVQSDEPSDFIISSGKLHTVAEFVTEVARQCGIQGGWDRNYETFTGGGASLVKAGSAHLKRPYEPRKPIRFKNDKLKSIGWNPGWSTIGSIVSDMLNN